MESAFLAREGILGPEELFAADDGIGAFLAHRAIEAPLAPVLDEAFHVELDVRTTNASSPRSDTDARQEIRRLKGERAAALEAAIDELPHARNLKTLSDALGNPI